MQLDYGMVDADNHFYEPTDALTRLPPGLAPPGRLLGDRGRWAEAARDRRSGVGLPANPTFDPIVRPGLLDRRNVEPIANRPEYRDPAKRIARFDEQGIHSSLMFPTLMNGLGEIVGNNLSLHVDLVWAFNQWLDEDWGFAYQNRIFGTPLFSLTDPDQSVEMLEWALDRGCRADPARRRPGPHRSRLEVTGRPRLRPVLGPAGRGQGAGVRPCRPALQPPLR